MTNFDDIETIVDNWKDSPGDLTFEALIKILTIGNLNSVNHFCLTIYCDIVTAFAIQPHLATIKVSELLYLHIPSVVRPSTMVTSPHLHVMTYQTTYFLKAYDSY